MRQDPATAPAQFQEVLRTLGGARVRGDVRLVEVPAPGRIAPYAVAVAGEVEASGEEAASGRLVALHDPAGPDAWGGDLRVIALAKAEVEPEVGGDEMWAQVAWSWLADALADAPHHSLGGTVTKVVDESFGDADAPGSRVRVELRASWTPTGADMEPHVRAWANLMGSFAGVPPMPEGVTMLRGSQA